MSESASSSKPSFFKSSQGTSHHDNHQQHITKHFYRSESKLILNKLTTDKAQIFPKQYTNKYFRTTSLYEEKENQKMLYLHKLYTFARKNKAAKIFKARRFINCPNEPNQDLENRQNHYEGIKSELKIKSGRGNNNTTFDRPYFIQHRLNAGACLIQELLANEKINKRPKLREINLNTNHGHNNNQNSQLSLSKEKISTSRALQKYAKLIKDDIFHSSKSHLFDKSPIRKERSHHYTSNIETKQMVLCPKDTKMDLNNRQLKRPLRRTLYKRQQTMGDLSSYLHEQSYDINGWQTTS